jgi:hypothetical protein
LIENSAIGEYDLEPKDGAVQGPISQETEAACIGGYITSYLAARENEGK